MWKRRKVFLCLIVLQLWLIETINAKADICSSLCRCVNESHFVKIHCDLNDNRVSHTLVVLSITINAFMLLIKQHKIRRNVCAYRRTNCRLPHTKLFTSFDSWTFFISFMFTYWRSRLQSNAIELNSFLKPNEKLNRIIFLDWITWWKIFRHHFHPESVTAALASIALNLMSKQFMKNDTNWVVINDKF